MTDTAVTPRIVYDHLDRYVVGQEAAKKAVAIAAYGHVQRLAYHDATGGDLIRKSNVLLVGPTGCGKTHIARSLAAFLELPFTIADATEYTEAGYYGKDVEVMIGELLYATDGDIERTQRGIVFIDEIDKVARKSGGMRTGAGSRDIGGEGVQQSLLKILEGQKLFVPLNVTQHWNKHDFVQIDTTHILFICAGAFSDLRPELAEKEMGFTKTPGADPAHATRPILPDDLVKFGMLPELVGRLPVVVTMGELTDDQLLQVLTVPPDSLVAEYRQLLALDEIDLSFDEGALVGLVAEARKRKVGARGLRSIMERAMADILFTAPERRGEAIRVTGETVSFALADRR